MDIGKTRVSRATRDLSAEAEGVEQSAAHGCSFYLDRASFKAAEGLYDNTKGGEPLDLGYDKAVLIYGS